MNRLQLKNQLSSFVFFGTPEFAVIVLDELKKRGFVPSLIVTASDKPRGRKLLLTPPPAKIWAEKNSIPYIQPEKLSPLPEQLMTDVADLYMIAAYGKIIPKSVLALPRHGTLNVHPSLLPAFRGSSPIQSAILTADTTGTTIMLVDEELDHGPIIAQEKLDISMPIARLALEEKLARLGGRLLAEIIPKWIVGKITPLEQAHATATYTKKIAKEDGMFELSDVEKNPKMLYRKFSAYEGWPSLYFFIPVGGKKTRIIVKDAVFENDTFIIKKVLPEGKTLISWDEFQKTI
jgi:methionyl-tRNA formyltransferase